MTRTDQTIIRLVKEGVPVPKVAAEVRRTRAWVYMVCQRENVVPADYKRPKPSPPPPPPPPARPALVPAPSYKAGRREGATGSLRRFKSATIDPSRVVGLADDHPAVVEGRTLFPTTVVDPEDSPRLFVSGVNNPKLGGHVTKGDRAGWPIYQLSLEERATCPRTCAVWEACYGNGMHRARRHRNTATLIPMMKAELRELAEKHPAGFLIRLHTLGDFYSVAYVRAWADMLDELPALHVFGFTARSLHDDDIESRRIALAISYLTDMAWDRFAVRWSDSRIAPQGSFVTTEPSEDPLAIMCPAQREATEACGTCGLCWAPAARERAIGFLLHGLKRRAAVTEDEMPKPPVQPTTGRKPRQRPWGTWQGTAAESLTTTAEERLAAVSDEARAEIEARYGAKFKG